MNINVEITFNLEDFYFELNGIFDKGIVDLLESFYFQDDEFLHHIFSILSHIKVTKTKINSGILVNDIFDLILEYV